MARKCRFTHLIYLTTQTTCALKLCGVLQCTPCDRMQLVVAFYGMHAQALTPPEISGVLLTHCSTSEVCDLGHAHIDYGAAYQWQNCTVSL